MKEVLAVIRMSMMNKTKKALEEAGISSFTTIANVMGRGRGKVDLKAIEGAKEGYEEAIAQLGQGPRLKAKRLITIVAPDPLVKKVVHTIMEVNQTGKSGDGKIFVMPIHDAVRVRNGEKGDGVLDK